MNKSNHFSTEHWNDQNDRPEEIVDRVGAMKILGVTKPTIIGYERDGLIKGFKYILNGRKRICYDAKILKDIVSASESVA